MVLKIIETKPAPAQVIMDLDGVLLANLEKTPLLHLYEWAGPSATYGHFVKPADFLNLEQAKKRGLALGRRPTGGGIIFHVSDWAFSVLVPSSHPQFSLNTLDNYKLINNAVLLAVKEFLGQDPNLLPSEPIPMDESCRSFCMAKPTKYDVMLGPQKIAGAAQRRVRQGFLHQGSISIAHPCSSFLKDVLLPNTQVLAAMEQNTFSLLGRQAQEQELATLRMQMQILLTKHLKQVLNE